MEFFLPGPSEQQYQRRSRSQVYKQIHPTQLREFQQQMINGMNAKSLPNNQTKGCIIRILIISLIPNYPHPSFPYRLGLDNLPRDSLTISLEMWSESDGVEASTYSLPLRDP
jgi:hypothetical protein